MTDENEAPKISKAEEKESFLKRLEEKTTELKATEERIKALVDRNEELVARKLLGGQTDNVADVEKPKEETPLEYVARIRAGRING